MTTAAIVFSGQLRSFAQCRKNIEQNVLQVLAANGIEYDIFVHVWNDEDQEKIQYLKEVWPKARVFQSTLPKELFNPQPWSPHISLGIGSNLESTTKERDRMFTSLCYQWCGLARAFDIFRQIREKHYTVVFRCRPDVMYDRPLELLHIPIGSKTLYVGPKHTFPRNNRPTNVNNVFAYGNQDAMDIYSKFYHNLPRVLDKLTTLGDNDPDAFLKKNYSLNNYFRFYLERMKYMEIRDSPQDTLINRDGMLVTMLP